MSKKKVKKKVVVGNKNKATSNSTKTVTVDKTKISPTASRRTKNTSKTPQQELLFGKQNYILMVAGAALVIFGMVMMLGGSMPDPNTWDPDIIYSPRITVLGPMMILGGLILEIYAIFKK